MKTIEEIRTKRDEIMNLITGTRKVSERVALLKKNGYIANECPMGTGGVGQIKEMSDHYRIQIGYGHGRNNYAYAVIISK